MLDRIGLYDKLEPRGIIAPLFHYWDRAREQADRRVRPRAISRTTRAFPTCCSASASRSSRKRSSSPRRIPTSSCGCRRPSRRSRRMPTACCAQVTNAAGEAETIRGAYLVSAEGARSIVRKDLGIEFEGFTYPDRTLNIEVAYDFRRHGYTERNYISDPTNGRTCFTGRAAGPLARALSRPRPTTTRRADASGGAAGAAAAVPADRQATSTSSAATSIRCISGWRRNSASDARSSPAMPRT